MRTAILGAGGRGTIYAGYALDHPREVSISAVIEPRAEWRHRLGDRHGLPAEARFADWSAFAQSPLLEQTDAVVNATPDRAHAETAAAVLDAGLPMLLEKPIAATAHEVLALGERCADAATPSVVVAHVLRHTRFYHTLRDLIRDGAVGRVLQVSHQENLWFNHFAHSYVRGNWAIADASTPFILAKCCHDLDLFTWLFDDDFLAVTSAGRLDHFTAENRPNGATDRCTDGCPVACRHDARPLYLHGRDHWPANTISFEASIEARQSALETGPYGRCVYACDNDVPDHQVAMFEMASGATISLTISGHHHEEVRLTTIDGTDGTIVARFGRDPKIEVFPHPAGLGVVAPAQTLVGADLAAVSGHGGGDEAVMRDLVRTVIEPGYVSGSALLTALPSHLASLAAEESRLTSRRVSLDEFVSSI